MHRFKANAKVASKILNCAYTIIVVLFLLDALRLVEIKSQPLKSFIFTGLLIGTPLIFVWNLVALTTLCHKIVGLVLPVCAIIFILVVTPVKIIFSSEALKTQTVMYKNAHFSFKTIEYQMQDIGASGYHSRTVEILYLTKFFMIAYPVSEKTNLGIEWIKVNKDVNELEFEILKNILYYSHIAFIIALTSSSSAI